MISTAITYTAFSMDQITQLAETIGVQQEIRVDKYNESFDVVSVNIVNEQFNMTVKNTGNVPVHLTRLWIENTTDASWPVSKFDMDIALAPGNTVKNIGLGIGLTALATQSYHAQIISERGNQKEMFLNTVGDSSIITRVSATPAVMPTGFTTTVTLEIINTGTTQLLNLQPDMVSVSTPICTACLPPVLEGGPSPTSFGSLAPGDNAFFEWEYSYTGETGDNISFEAGILNDARTDSVLVSLQTVETSLNTEISVESGGIGDQAILGDGILIFHQETTDESAYQLYSGSEDGGSDGSYVKFTTPTPTPTFLTKNGALANSIPAGNWEFALMISSEFMSENIDNINKIPDMIFHFEDGINVPPDNSQGDFDRDLMGCQIDTEIEVPSSDTNTGREHTNNGDVKKGDPEFGVDRMGALRFTNLDIDRGEQINTTYVTFHAKEKLNVVVNIRIYGIPADGDTSAIVAADGTYSISNRAPFTTAYVDWMDIPPWSEDEISADTTTPDLSSIISEITSHASWDNGDDLMLIFADHPTSPSDDRRKGDKPSSAPGYPNLFFNVGSGIYPTWVDNSGPHLSASLQFNGIDDCLKSVRTVQADDNNDLRTNDFSTSLWFKTTDNDLAIAEDMYLVNWEDGNTCDDCEHFKIFLTSGAAGTAGGKITVSAASDTSSDTYSLTTVNDYDDNQWYHISTQIDTNTHYMFYEIIDVAGTVLEWDLDTFTGTWNEDLNIGSNHWHVGSNVAEDGNYFKGYIDDVIHWDDAGLTGAEMRANARTNYGDGAHQFNVYVDKTDEFGLNSENIYTSILPFDMPFADPKSISLSNENDDTTYTQMNMTVPMAQIDLLAQQRLNVTLSWVAPTALWEALEVDMKFDDTDISVNANPGNSNPYVSFLQIPEPDRGFPSYFIHDPENEFVLYVVNVGTDGMFLTYQGTRVSFNGTMGSYAGLIHSANGTGTSGDGSPEVLAEPSCSTYCKWNLDQNHDSLHIPPGEIVRLYFYVASDIPSTDQSGSVMVDGDYNTTIWLNGYSDQGESFLRSIVVGKVGVFTP